MPFGFLIQHRLYILRAANKAVQGLELFPVSHLEWDRLPLKKVPLKKVPGEGEDRSIMPEVHN